MSAQHHSMSTKVVQVADSREWKWNKKQIDFLAFFSIKSQQSVVLFSVSQYDSPSNMKLWLE